MGIAESAVDLLMQCATFENKRESLLRTISGIAEVVDKILQEEHDQVIYWLLGKAIEGVSENSMVCTWLGAGQSITGMN